MVGALNWGSSSLGPSPGGGCFVVFLGNELRPCLQGERVTLASGLP